MRTFQELFKGFTLSYGYSQPKGRTDPDKPGKVEFFHGFKPGSPPPDEWEMHFAGREQGLGIIPLMDDSTSVMWGCIDIDKFDIDFQKLENDIGQLPLVITKSKSGRPHLWLFLLEPTPAQLVQKKLREWACALGHGGGKVDIFPMQYKRIGKDLEEAEKGLPYSGGGNWVNLPYFGDTRRCFYQGQLVDRQTFVELANQRSITKKQLESIEVLAEEGQEFSDGPPCLQMLVQIGGMTEGARNTCIFNVGVYFKDKNPEDWRERLMQFNREFVQPPEAESEVASTVKQLDKKGYNYQCSRSPLKEHCNRQLCLKRQFGIARNGDNEQVKVNLERLVKYNSTNPEYKLTVDGVQVNLGSDENLRNQQKFIGCIFRALDRLIDPVKGDVWTAEVKRLLETIQIIQMADEASPEGTFHWHLCNFIDIHQSDTKDSLAAGNVWIDGGFAYFRARDLERYLNREGFRDLTKTRMHMIITEMGGDHGRFNIKGKTVSFYKIKADNLQVEEFEPPTFGQEVFGGGN